MGSLASGGSGVRRSGVASKTYGRAYFDRWYRTEGFGHAARLARKIELAVATAEYLIEGPVRAVLDVGCGEGAWQPVLRRLRPKARYLGVDPSAYAVERFGRRRNLRLGGIAALDDVVPVRDGRYDLIVCADVLCYVDDREVRRALEAIAARLDGVAYVEAYGLADEIEGDVRDFHRRRRETYDRWFADVGLRRVGPHLYVGEVVGPLLATFEGPLGTG